MENRISEYDLTNLQIITARKRDFKMFITERLRWYYVDNVYEEYTSDLLLKYVKDGSIFIDIGAHYGYYTLLIAFNKPDCRVMAFEPVPENFQVLEKNIEINNLKNVTSYQMAVSDKSGMQKFQVTEASDNCGFHRHPLSGSIKEIEVETIELDSLLKDADDQEVTIKINTEGHETHVLDGMEYFLKHHGNVRLIVEFNPKCMINAGYKPDELLNKILGWDFDIYFILDDKRLFYKLDPAQIDHWPDYMQGYESSYLNILCIKKSRSLNICFFSHQTSLLGAERSMLELCKELIEDRGVLVTVILRVEGPLEEELLKIGAAVISVNYSWWCDLTLLTQVDINARLAGSYLSLLHGLKDKVSKINPDVIVTNTLVIPWGAIAANFLNKPHVWFVREYGELGLKLKFLLPFADVCKFIIDSSNAVITNSHAIREALFPGAPPDRVFTVYTYFDIPMKLLEAEGRLYYHDKKALKLLIAGTVSEQKGQKDAVLAVKELTRRGENVELIILGRANQDYVQELQRIIDDNDLSLKITFIDFNQNPYRIMARADIILVCSRFEGFGRVTAEAMILKKPVIGTDSGGTSELIQEGYNGLLYKPGNYEQLADRIEYLIKNREKIKEFGKNGYAFARKTLSRDKFGGKIYEIFLQIKGSGNTASSTYGKFASQIALDAIETLENNSRIQAAELGNVIAARDAQINGLINLAKDTEENNRLKIDELNRVVLGRDLFIMQIMSGTVMRLMTRFKTTVEKLLPPGTAGNRFYNLVIRSLQIIANEGWSTFGHEVRLWLKGRNSSYEKWIYVHEPDAAELEDQRRQALSFGYRPKISIIMPTWNTDEKLLKSAINSVLNQSYDNWELCIADGGSSKSTVRKLIHKYAKHEPRIKAKFLDSNKGISGNSNEALSLATGEFIALLDHDDEIAPFALYEIAKILNQNPLLDFVYSDEDIIYTDGYREGPSFKPDWSPDLLLSWMYTCHLGVYRKKLIDEIGGFRSEYDGSQDYDLVLRLIEKTTNIHHIPKILYHWRTHPYSAAGNNAEAKPYAHIAGGKAINDYLKRNSIDGEVLDGEMAGLHRVKRKIKGNPLVSIIIPTKDNQHMLQTCITSILQKTVYENYEIIVINNQSQEQETKEYLNEIGKHPKITVLNYDQPFNFSAINNFAASQSRGDHLLFLNNDTEVIAEDWLSSMLEHSQRPEVGAVGAKLIFPDGRIQHCGVIVGIAGVAGHAHYGSSFHLGRPSVIGNYSAVTAACIMIRKAVFSEIGGFDEKLAVLYNDVDLCLRIRKRKYLIVYTPYATLYHFESATKMDAKQFDPYPDDTNYFRSKWAGTINKGDPQYNPNLALDRTDFSYRI